MIRGTLRALGWALFSAVIVLAVLVAHLSTPLGRAAVAQGAGNLLSSRIRGTAHIGSVTALSLSGIAMRDVVITAPGGERVISARRWEAGFAFEDSWNRGILLLAPSRLEGGSMRLTAGPGDRIELIHAMEVPDDRFMWPVEVADLSLSDLSIVFALPGVPLEVEMRDVSGVIDMQLGHRFHCRMDRLGGYVNVPIVHVGFSRLSGRLSSDVATPLVVRMALDLEVAEPTMEVRYRLTRGDRARGGHMEIRLGADVPDARHLATAGK